MSASRVKRRLQPLDLARVEQHHVKPARGHDPQPQQVVPGRKDDAPLFGIAYAGPGTTMVATRTATHLDEDTGAIGCAHDEINFAATSPGRPIIALHQLQAVLLQVSQCYIFGSIPHAFGGAVCRRFGWKGSHL